MLTISTRIMPIDVSQDFQRNYGCLNMLHLLRRRLVVTLVIIDDIVLSKRDLVSIIDPHIGQPSHLIKVVLRLVVTTATVQHILALDYKLAREPHLEELLLVLDRVFVNEGLSLLESYSLVV